MKKQVLITALGALLLGLVTVPALAMAAAGAGIDTAPVYTNKALYFDANHDDASQPGELVGSYDVYDIQQPFNFHWAAVPGAAYYRVSLIQYALPGKGEPSPSQEIKIAHHSASDPNGPRFSMSLDGPVCTDCVTIVKVVPETAAQGPDGNMVYTELPGQQVSGPFIFELLGSSGTHKSELGPLCGDGICSHGEGIKNGPNFCQADCGPAN